MKVLKTWESWSLYSTSYLSQLRAAFLDLPYEGTPERTKTPSPDSDDFDVPSPALSSPDVERYDEGDEMDDNIDGSPLYDKMQVSSEEQPIRKPDGSPVIIEYDKELDGYPLDDNGQPIYTDDEADDLF